MTPLVLGLPFFIPVLGITGHRCRLPTFGMEAFERGGDVLLGGVFPLHPHQSIDAVKIAFTQRPSPMVCHRLAPHRQILPGSLTSPSKTAKDGLGQISPSLSFWFYKLIQTMVFATEEINQDPTLLPNITLGFQIFDSCSVVSRALLGTMQFLTGFQKVIPNFRCREHPPPAGVIAEAGITETGMIARLLDLNRFPQISYFPMGPVTNGGSQFPSFFRTVPSNELQALGLAQLVIHFAWSWIGLLGEDSEYGKQGVEVVREQVLKKSVCVAFEHMLSISPNRDNAMEVVDIIKDSQARVIVAFCGVEMLAVLNRLHEQGVRGRVWLYSESMTQIVFFKDQKANQMLSGSLAVVHHKEKVPGLRDFVHHLHPSSSPEDVFIQEFWSKVFNCWWNASSGERTNNAHRCTGEESLGNGTNSFLSMPGFGLAFSVHNAVYAIAHALHNMMQEEPRGPKTFGNRTQLLRYLRKVHFKNKAAEEVFFDEHGDLPAPLDIFNTLFRSQDEVRIVLVGRIAFGPSQIKELEVNHNLSICTRCPEDQWPDEEQTRCLPKRELFLPFLEPLGTGLAGTSVCGSLLPILVLALFVARRDTPLVRANSYELSYLLLAGLSAGFLSCLLFLGRPTRSACLLRPVVFGLAFALCLSCLLAKTLMVVAAFRATNPGSRVRRCLDPRVARAVVLGGCLPQVLLCAMWLAVSPPSSVKDTSSVPRAITLLCVEGSPAAFWGMLLYLGLLAGFTLAGASLARNLPDAFNEAWLICFSLLGCLGVWMAFVPVYLTARGRHTAAAEAFAILGSSAALLSGMFFPKCYILLVHPELNTRGYLMRKGPH
uniref:extracellular calcium-sensing receptor-like n=1 Tax=Euleptes europaea TaxID=460621 RepID=UPI0025421D17|nr:extracellular calcium-sensing receptor-like [Euleptes europaea]